MNYSPAPNNLLWHQDSLSASLNSHPSPLVVTDGSRLASILSEGIGADDKGLDIRNLTESAVKPSVESSSGQIKDIVLELLHIIEAWASQRTSFCAATVALGNNESVDEYVAMRCPSKQIN
jgi:hypothetical protein